MSGPWRVADGPAGTLRSYATASALGSPPGPLLVICHELPRATDSAAEFGRTFPSLADRLASESGCRVVAGMLRGVGGSEGDFSASGWLEDLCFFVDREAGPDGAVWLVGFGLGGALALRAAADDPRVRGVAALATPADLSSWAADPEPVLTRCRRSGVIHTRGFPADVAPWAASLAALQPLEAAGRLGGRPLLVVHGTEDDEVATAAARALADAASGSPVLSSPDPVAEAVSVGVGAPAEGAGGAGAPSGGSPVELRLVPGAGHWLRADPRVVATLIGWIERQG